MKISQGPTQLFQITVSHTLHRDALRIAGKITATMSKKCMPQLMIWGHSCSRCIVLSLIISEHKAIVS